MNLEVARTERRVRGRAAIRAERHDIVSRCLGVCTHCDPIMWCVCGAPARLPRRAATRWLRSTCAEASSPACCAAGSGQPHTNQPSSSAFLACNGSPCLWPCVHGASIAPLIVGRRAPSGRPGGARGASRAPLSRRFHPQHFVTNSVTTGVAQVDLSHNGQPRMKSPSSRLNSRWIRLAACSWAV
jgi:hypothetical protein